MYEELVKSLRETRERIRSKPDVLMYVPPYQLSAAVDAIEELNQRVEKLEALREISPEAEYTIDKYADNLISNMEELISGLKDKPRWIPVTERLPEKYKPVLCFGYNGIIVDYFSGETSELFKTPLFMICEGKVTHWMPLPEPPKEEIE